MKSTVATLSLLSLGLLILLTTGSRSAHVATDLPSPDDDLIVGARAIVIGRVLSLSSRLDADNDRIFTYITIRVEETLKGEISDRRIVLKEEGGEVEGHGSIIFGAPQFSLGERVFLYLDTWPDGSLRVHQMSFGKLSVVGDGEPGESVVRSQQSCTASVERSRRHNHSFDSSTVSNDLSEYVSNVRLRLEATSARSQAFQLKHYRSVPILSQPSEYQRAVSRGEVHPQFKLLFPLKSVRWFEPDNNQAVVFYVNPDGAPNPQAVEDVGAALTAWSNVAGCSLRLVNGGASSACSTQRTVNAISFNNCDGRFSPSAECSRIIALGGLRWDSEVVRQVNGQSYVTAAYGFISFNPYSACSFDNHCDLREVATHELGHALGLGHSQHPDATMYGAAHFDGRCAGITEDDVSGIAFVYPINDLGSRPLTIDSASTLPSAVTLVNHLQGLESSGGVLPHTWSVVDFLGRPPTGLSVSSGGIIFGMPTQTGSFDFTLRVTDGLGTSVQKRFTMAVREPVPFDSQFMSQTIVSTVQTGQQFGAVLKWLNNGSEIWDGSIRAVAQNPAGNTIWSAAIAPVFGLTLKGLLREIRLTAVAPRLAGTYDFQWQLFQDGRGFFGQPSTNLRIVVTAGPPAIDSPSPPQGFIGSPYSYQLTVAGGTPPHIWSTTAGSLPPGLMLDANTGVISGIPTTVGSATFTVQVKDSVLRSAQRQYSIAIGPAPPSPLRIEVASAIQALRGSPLTYQPSASGGTPPYNWAIATGTLPAGLTLNNSTGAIAGTPSVSGEFSATISVRDQRNQTASGSIQIKVGEPEPAPVITKVKYKVAKKKIIVTGDRFDANATLIVDGTQVTAQFESGVLIAKPVPLASGAHEVRVVNPSGVSSQSFSFTVN